jgi:hypothetical protein
MRRLDAIRDLWDLQCKRDGIDYWNGWALKWAVQMAREVPVRVQASDYAQRNAGQAAEELSAMYNLQAWGLPIQIVDPALLAGHGEIRDCIQTEVAKAVERAMKQLGQEFGQGTIEKVQSDLPQNWADAEQRTLHEAIDAYKEHLKATGKREQAGGLSHFTRRCVDRLDYLKQGYKDMPIWELNLPVLQTMTAYWQNRPKTKKGTRCSWDHAKGMLKEFFRFLSWLDEHPSYKWTMPRGAEKISRSPIKLPQDDRNHNEAFRTITKDTYTPEQLAVLADFTDDFGRALIGLCVNCAFGASEAGQWPAQLFTFHKAHPHAAEVEFDSTDSDSWVTGPRPKTGVYGEHLLWPSVAIAVEPFLRDKRPVFPMTSKGNPWFRPHSANPQTAFGNWWYRLLDRVEEKHPEFPRLPFGSLRDLLPNLLRHEYGDEVASMCLQHGENKHDDLLDCYANVPFRKLFRATKEIESRFKPLLDKLGR